MTSHKPVSNYWGIKVAGLMSAFTLASLLSCGAGGGGGSSSNSNTNTETKIFTPKTTFEAPTIDQYTASRSQIDRFLDEVDNGLVERSPISTNQDYLFVGNVILESSLFGTNQLYGQTAIEFNFDAQSGFAEIGGLALIDPDNLQIINQLAGGMAGNMVTLNSEQLEADLSGNLEYQGLVLDTDLNVSGAFYNDEGGNISLPLVLDGNMRSDSGVAYDTSGIGLARPQ